jgi:L-iditol 2-dehydrogenase
MSTATPTTMRAAVLYGKEDLRIETLPVPQPGPGEALLKIEAALTCGTDLKVYRRGYHAAMLKPPCRFGHECAGEIVALGANVKSGSAPDLKIGERVVTANSAPCGQCYYCQHAQENLCDDLQFLNGAYAEYILLPERFVRRNVWRIPETLSFAHAAMTEPLACVVHGLAETAPRAGDTAAVIGLGPIGLYWIALLKQAGCRVVGVGRRAKRLAAAYALGAETLEADHNGAWVEQARQRTHFDMVVEATGQPSVWEQAVSLVRKGGVVNLFGGPPSGTRVSLETNRLHYDQITLKSSFHHRPAEIQAALNYLSTGAVPAEKFISGVRPLTELPELFREMCLAQEAVKTEIRVR